MHARTLVPMLDGRGTLPSAVRRLPPASPGYMQPHSKSAQIVYVSDIVYNVVNVYAQVGSGQLPIGQLTGSNGILEPYGIYVSPVGDLYVSSNFGYVMAYHEAQLFPFNVWYNGSGAASFDVTTIGDKVYATEFPSGLIREYSTTQSGCFIACPPLATLHDNNMVSVYSLTSNSKGDLFVDGYTSAGNVIVDEFPAGQQTPKTIQTIGVYFSTAFPGPMTVDIKGNLIVANESNFFGSAPVLTFAPPYNGSAISTVNIPSESLTAMALTQNGQNMWLSNFSSSFFEFLGQEYTTGGGLLDSLSTFDISETLGTAASPHNRVGP